MTNILLEILHRRLVELSTISHGSTHISVLRWEMVDNSTSPLQAHFGPVFVMRESRQAFPAQSAAPFKFFCWQFHHFPRDMTPQLHLICLALKGKRSAEGERAPRALSIGDGFCRLPESRIKFGFTRPSGLNFYNTTLLNCRIITISCNLTKAINIARRGCASSRILTSMACQRIP